MRNRIQTAFDSVQASPELKNKTRDFLAHERQRRSVRPVRALVPALCSLLLLVLGAVGWGLYQTPVAAISVDINPSLELTVNRFDRVIGVKGFNEDGEAVAAHVDLINMRYDEAVETLLQSEAISPYLSEDAFVSIAVACDEQEKGEAMRRQVQAGTAECTAEVSCTAGNSEDVEQAHEAGLSFGKYRAFEELQALDPSVTAEDVQGMTMREIRDRINELLEEAGEEPSGQGQGQGQGSGQGQQGQGTGQGSGQGQQGQGSGQGSGQSSKGEGNSSGKNQGSQNGDGNQYGRNPG